MLTLEKFEEASEILSIVSISVARPGERSI